ncbi:MAG: MerR family DNA-binding transcriptional regulator [Nocardiopsaceae bacterium]|nr:MerR family DNA-binding transcriptional regulator [Nocardiopsaceae bacterium]
MGGLRVSELAARAGVPPSTVRYYERAGLIRPARRAANGYRLFDESAADDLALIGRARSAGMRLEAAAGLVAAWHDGSCRSLRERIRAHLTTELARAGQRAADLAAFRRKLEAMLGRLAAGGAADGDARDRCGPDCGCDRALDPGTGTATTGTSGIGTGGDGTGGDGTLPGCSLGRTALADRLDQWRALAEAAEAAEHDGDTVRLTLDPAAIPAAAALMAAEAVCCQQARFTLSLTEGRLSLTARIPGIEDLGRVSTPGCGNATRIFLK